MNKINWVEIINEISNTDGKKRPIYFEEEYYDFIICGDKKRMMGFMMVWNVDSLRAIHISRMHINENLFFLPMTGHDREIPQGLKIEDLTPDIDE